MVVKQSLPSATFLCNQLGIIVKWYVGTVLSKVSRNSLMLLDCSTPKSSSIIKDDLLLLIDPKVYLTRDYKTILVKGQGSFFLIKGYKPDWQYCGIPFMKLAKSSAYSYAHSKELIPPILQSFLFASLYIL